MSDHESSEAPPEKRSLFAAVNGRRVSIALVVIALTWLGVWVYTSDSAATSSSGTVATVATTPGASAPARHHAGKRHQRSTRSTILPPPPNLARTPQAYTTALVGYWSRRDRQAALHVATEQTVSHLFARRPLKNEQMVLHGCQGAGAFTNCTWSSVKREVVFQVQNQSASTSIRVVGVTIQHL